MLDIYHWFISQLQTNQFMSAGIGTGTLFLVGKHLLNVLHFLKKQFILTVSATGFTEYYSYYEQFVRSKISKPKTIQMYCFNDSYKNSNKRYNIGRKTLMEGSYLFWYNGLPVFCRISNDVEVTESSPIDFKKRITLYFLFRTESILDIVFEESILPTLTDERISVYRYNTYWTGHINKRKRSLDSIFIPTTLKDNLLLDIKKFISSEDNYNLVGDTYKRNYLFYGKPGTGKTSLIYALASYFDMDIKLLNLNGLSDDSLIAAIQSVDKGSFLVIEDIDAMTDAGNERVGFTNSKISTDSKLSLSALLNSLDGISTPDGLITFITTNHLEKLDKALVRDGRIDYKLEVPLLSEVEAREMYKRIDPCGDFNVFSKTIVYPIAGSKLRKKIRKYTHIH